VKRLRRNRRNEVERETVRVAAVADELRHHCPPLTETMLSRLRVA
jgi:hypothetical protein